MWAVESAERGDDEKECRLAKEELAKSQVAFQQLFEEKEKGNKRLAELEEKLQEVGLLREKEAKTAGERLKSAQDLLEHIRAEKEEKEKKVKEVKEVEDRVAKAVEVFKGSENGREWCQNVRTETLFQAVNTVIGYVEERVEGLD